MNDIRKVNKSLGKNNINPMIDKNTKTEYIENKENIKELNNSFEEYMRKFLNAEKTSQNQNQKIPSSQNDFINLENLRMKQIDQKVDAIDNTKIPEQGKEKFGLFKPENNNRINIPKGFQRILNRHLNSKESNILTGGMNINNKLFTEQNLNRDINQNYENQNEILNGIFNYMIYNNQMMQYIQSLLLKIPSNINLPKITDNNPSKNSINPFISKYDNFNLIGDINNNMPDYNYNHDQIKSLLQQKNIDRLSYPNSLRNQNILSINDKDYFFNPQKKQIKDLNYLNSSLKDQIKMLSLGNIDEINIENKDLFHQQEARQHPSDNEINFELLSKLLLNNHSD